MTEVKKFNPNDQFEEFDNDATEKDVSKASQTGFIKVGTFTLEVASAKLHLDKKSDKDPAFFKFVISVRNSAGETRDVYSQFSFKKFKYGEKGTLVFAVKLKELFRAFGFPELSLKDLDKLADKQLMQKYMTFDENGLLPLWEGLKFEGTFAYPKDSFHMEKDSHELKPWYLADSNGSPAIFQSLKVFDDVTGGFIEAKNQVLRAATSDSLKSEAGVNGVASKIQMSELKFLKPIPGSNTTKLAKFEIGSKPVEQAKTTIVDPQTLVTPGKQNDGFPL